MEEIDFPKITERLLKNPKYLDEIKKELTPYWKEEYNKYLAALIVQTLDKESHYRTIRREAKKKQYNAWQIDIQTSEYYIDVYAKRSQLLLEIQELITGEGGTEEKLEKEQPRLIDLLDTSDNATSLNWIKSEFKGQRGKRIAYLIFALKAIKALKPAGLIQVYEALKSELGDIGCYESIRKTEIPTKGKQLTEYRNVSYKVIPNIVKNPT